MRITGGLKSFNSKRYINTSHIRPITDKDEIFFHLLECITTTLILERGPVCHLSNFPSNLQSYLSLAGQHWFATGRICPQGRDHDRCVGLLSTLNNNDQQHAIRASASIAAENHCVHAERACVRRRNPRLGNRTSGWLWKRCCRDQVRCLHMSLSTTRSVTYAGIVAL